MSMSDCVNCWETPCVCGSGYRDLSDERRIEIASAALGMKPHELRAQLSAQSVSAAQPVGTVGRMPGTTGFTMACFSAAVVPEGTKLYVLIAKQADADAVDAKEKKCS